MQSEKTANDTAAVTTATAAVTTASNKLYYNNLFIKIFVTLVQ